jgi:hypothetical protein
MSVLSSRGFYSACILACLLTACGGSDSNTNDTIEAPKVIQPAPTVLQGVFIDSAVQGLAYSTSTQSGVTDEQGRFSYLEGEEVTFSIGDIQFPAVIGQDVISPLDVFATTMVDDLRVSNMARLLQTLDEDGSAGNGITITAQAHTQAMGAVVDFASVDFAQQVVDVVANSGAVYTTLISSQSALAHLNLTLGNATSSRSCASDSAKIGYTGTFSNLAHNVSGMATVVDNCRLEITMFNFDGAAPNVRFYAAQNGNFASDEAFAVSDRLEGQSYTNETIILELPDDKLVDDFDSLSVWCVAFTANFGSLRLVAP